MNFIVAVAGALLALLFFSFGWRQLGNCEKNATLYQRKCADLSLHLYLNARAPVSF